MSTTKVTVNAGHLRKHLRLPTDATDEQVTAALEKPAPTKRRNHASATGQRNDDAQRRFYAEHFPELEGGG